MKGEGGEKDIYVRGDVLEIKMLSCKPNHSLTREYKKNVERQNRESLASDSPAVCVLWLGNRTVSHPNSSRGRRCFEQGRRSEVRLVLSVTQSASLFTG